MTAHASDSREGQHWESVHVCPNCGHVINLAELDLTAITTGIVTVQAAIGLGRSKYKSSIKCLVRSRLRSSYSARPKWGATVVCASC
jgi:hypothetical protein